MTQVLFLQLSFHKMFPNLPELSREELSLHHLSHSVCFALLFSFFYLSLIFLLNVELKRFIYCILANPKLIDDPKALYDPPLPRQGSFLRLLPHNYHHLTNFNSFSNNMGPVHHHPRKQVPSNCRMISFDCRDYIHRFHTVMQIFRYQPIIKMTEDFSTLLTPCKALNSRVLNSPYNLSIRSNLFCKQPMQDITAFLGVKMPPFLLRAGSYEQFKSPPSIFSS